MDRAELFAALKERPEDPAEAQAFDDAVAEAAGDTVAVLITDLSGFTRLTKKYGILHFLWIFQRAMTVAVDEVTAHGGRLVKTTADNVIAVFPDPAQALTAARAIFADADIANTGLSEDVHMRMSAGIGYGEMLLLDDDMFGDDLNVAFKLGEDIAEPLEILLSEQAVAYLRGAGMNGDRFDGPRSEIVGGTEIVHYAARPL